MTEPADNPLEKLVAAVAEYTKLHGGGNSTSSVVFNFGGWGVIVAVAAAAISLIVMAGQDSKISQQSMLISKQDIEIDRLRTEMNDKAETARDERATMKASLETQQAYLNVLIQDSKAPKEQK